MTAPHIFNATKINSQLLTGTMFILLSRGAEWYILINQRCFFSLSGFRDGTVVTNHIRHKHTNSHILQNITKIITSIDTCQCRYYPTWGRRSCHAVILTNIRDVALFNPWYPYGNSVSTILFPFWKLPWICL